MLELCDDTLTGNRLTVDDQLSHWGTKLSWYIALVKEKTQVIILLSVFWRLCSSGSNFNQKCWSYVHWVSDQIIYVNICIELKIVDDRKDYMLLSGYWRHGNWWNFKGKNWHLMINSLTEEIILGKSLGFQ